MMRFVSLFLLIFHVCAYAQQERFERKDGFLSVPDRIHAYFFTTKKNRLVVRDEGNIRAPRYGSLDAAMRKSPCRAGVNGGYFGADAVGSPLGMVVQDSKIISPLQTGSFTVSGIIYDTGKDIFLMRSKEFLGLKPRPKLVSALQAGPFLLEKGKLIAGLNDKRAAMRTFIATDGKGRWCLASTSRLTLKALAVWLSTPDCMGNFKPYTVLNLDGGSSSAFWALDTGVYFPSIKQVRNYIGVADR